MLALPKLFDPLIQIHDRLPLLSAANTQWPTNSKRGNKAKGRLDMVPLLLGVFALLTFLNLIEPTHAIYASQAGNIDWHEQYIGVPYIHSTAIQPRFHRIGAGKKAQAIYLSATESNVLAALNPSEGNVGTCRSNPAWLFFPHTDDQTLKIDFKCNI